jgi:type IV pilus assembly protein PilM
MIGMNIKGIFNKRAVGIDITDRSISVVEIKKGRDESDSNFGRIFLETGVIKQGKIIDEVKLSEAIKTVFRNASPRPIEPDEAIFGLPESQVFSHVFIASYKDDEELKKIVNQEAETTIPIPFNDLIFTYKILKNKSLKINDKEDKKTQEVLIMGVSKQVIYNWKEFFKKNGIKIEVLDFEILANYRALNIEEKNKPVCLVNIGAIVTDVSIVSNDDLYYSYSLNYAGESWTQKIIEEYTVLGKKIDYSTAENLKITNGLSRIDDPSGVSKILHKAIQPVIDEIKTAILIGKERSNQEVNNVILIGGSSAMSGLVEYVSSVLNQTGIQTNSNNNSGKIIIEIGRPKKIGGTSVDLTFNEPFGLALRGIESALFSKSNINITAELDKPDVKKEGIRFSDQEKNKSNNSQNDDNDDDEDEGGPQKKIKILIAILIFGVISISGAFFYNSYESKTKQLKPWEKKSIAPVSVNSGKSTTTVVSKNIEVEIRLSTDPKENLEGIAKGISFTEKIIKPTTYDKALEASKESAQKKLFSGLILYDLPISVSSQKESLIFPLEVTWLAYSKMKFELFCQDELLKKAGKEATLESFTISFVQNTGEENLYSLKTIIKYKENTLAK